MRTLLTRVALGLGLLASTAAGGQAQSQAPSSWLDKPLAGWNSAGGAIPTPPRADESREATIKRCQLTPPAATPAEQRVAAAGWIAFHNFDRQLVREDVEIVGGMAGADDMCRPMSYNLFVFVGGTFAGSMSPVPMASRSDAASGSVRILNPDTVSADFARYTGSDALCCPSSHVSVRFTIDRSGAKPVVLPAERRDRR